MTVSRLVWRWTLLGVACLAAAYATLVEPAWIEVTRHAVGAGQTGKQLRIVQLSDIHLKSIGETEDATLAATTELAPDMILLTGDIVDQPDALPVLDAFLSRLPPANRIAVPGNWEYWGGVDLAELRKTYERHGVTLLINQCVRMDIKGQPLQLAGLDDFTAGNPDTSKLDAACLGRGDRLILIQHSPGYFEATAKPASFPTPRLALSGHTHGGQVSLFGYAFWTPPGSGSFNRGGYDTDWGRLYVSRGIGTSITKIRFASRPEVAVFEWRP